MKYFSNSSGYDSQKSFIGGVQDLANKKRQEILNTANTEDIYEINGTKHYISKDTALDDIPKNLNPGDALLFERGGLWRTGKNVIKVPEGVIMGAYGEGDKPKFYNSVRNYANNSIWEKQNDNIWVTHIPYGNVGIIVFDDDVALGVKKWKMEDVTENYDYYFDGESDNLYFYYDSDLESDFNSIEIGTRVDVITLETNTIVDNICVKYTGAHGISIGSQRDNIKITNCEIGFIGGSCQFREVRYGNGIEIQLGGTNMKVCNNWVYQVYDAGITFQSWSSAGLDTYYNNIEISDNLVEFCHYGFEFFTTSPRDGGPYSEYRNISVNNNIFRFSGYAWADKQRPDHWMTSHVRSSQRGWIQPIENFKFTENVFDCSRANIFFWWWLDTAGEYDYPEKMPGFEVFNNSFYQAATPDKRCMVYVHEAPYFAENIDDLTVAVNSFDSAPKEIVWVDNIG